MSNQKRNGAGKNPATTQAATAVNHIELRSVADVMKHPEERVASNGKWVEYGKKNDYPDFLYECYKSNSTLKSIIDGLTDYTVGIGFVDEELNEREANRYGDTWLELVKMFAANYFIFGWVALQIIRNKKGDICELYVLDNRRVRLDENGKYVYYKKDWSKSYETAQRYNRWKRDTKYPNSVYIYKSPTSRDVYGEPIWESAVEDILTAIEIKHFHFSSILNNFMVSAIVSFNNGVPGPEQQKKIVEEVRKNFTGSGNAASLMVNFAADKNNAVEVSRLNEDNFDKKYDALARSVKENTFVAFRAIPAIFGCDPERTGFNAIEYENSFELFKATMVRPKQSEIENAFAKIERKADGSPLFQFKLKEFVVEFKDSEPLQVQPLTPTVNE